MRIAACLLALLLAPCAPSRASTKEELEFIKLERRIRAGDLPKINFEFDKWDILPESIPTIDAIVDVLLANPTLKLRILAHTDNIGTDEYNQVLSERRAKEVKKALVQRGVPPPSVRYNGYGATKPIADNDTDEGRAKNRRVEFRVTTRDWDSVY